MNLSLTAASVRGGTTPGAACRLAPSSTVLPQADGSRLRVAAGVVALLTSAFVLLLVLEPGGSGTVVAVSDVATVAAALAATAACARAGCRAMRSMRAFWWLLAAASAAWAVGESIWKWYEVIVGVQVPFPSWADVGYLAGAPLAVAAFLCHPATRGRRRCRIVPILDGLAVASALLFVSWTLVLGQLVSQTQGISAGAVVAVAYPFSDVVLLVLVVLALHHLQPGNRASTVLLLAGLFCMAVSDTAYTYLSQVDEYASGHLIDAGWFLSYLAIAAAAFLAPVAHAAPRATTERSGLLTVLAPFVPILVALVAVPYQVLVRDGLDPPAWGIATGLIVIVLARQLVYLHEQRVGTSTPEPAGPPVPPPRHASPLIPSPRAADDNRSQFALLTLQIIEASRPTVEERVHRASSRLVLGLTSTAAMVAIWDLSLLVNSAG